MAAGGSREMTPETPRPRGPAPARRRGRPATGKENAYARPARTTAGDLADLHHPRHRHPRPALAADHRSYPVRRHQPAGLYQARSISPPPPLTPAAARAGPAGDRAQTVAKRDGMPSGAVTAMGTP